MALSTTMTRFAQAVTGAVHQFAAAEGWQRDEYALTAIFDPEAERVHMTVGSIRPMNRVDWFTGILDCMIPIFGSRSQTHYHVSLIIQQLNHLDDIFARYRLEAHEFELTDFAR